MNFIVKNSLLNKEKLLPLIKEIFRFGIVGGIAFLVDTGTLLFFSRIVFGQPKVNPDLGYLMIAATLGFIFGVAVNYVLSVFFVFTSGKQKKQGRDLRGMVLFLIISVIGLLMTNGIILLLGHLEVMDVIAKMVAAGIVMVWNYTARKLLIFR